ncbi:YhgE/Pip domain-containing protein [Sporolactobacillus pectinivorans]|uniref:YhgE/Pip domain-containing protein n=1 Tax=Sporolactobacillus pectinivorans TaxID=1591408 RepID=UPI0012FE05D6|nr:YhgE/Pip domain-containing protein [Sporolactobacillus pectinivorans]
MKIIVEQWKEIFCKRSLLVTVIALMLVPLLYGGIFLSAFWNPYGHTSQLKVVVVNQDAGTQISGKTIDLGHSLTGSLKKDKTFHWVFLKDTKTAMQGLEEENYYMALIIPSSFSKNAATLMQGKPKQVELSYYTNSGESYTASQMVKSIIPKIDQTIAKEVTRNYALSLFSVLKKIDNQRVKDGEQLPQATKNLSLFVSGSNSIDKAMKQFAHSSLLFKNGLDQANRGSQDLDIGMHALHTGMKTLDQKIAQLAAGQDKINSGVMETADASKTLHQRMNQLNMGEQQFNQELGIILSYVEQVDSIANARGITMQQLNDFIKTQSQTTALDGTLQGQLPISQADYDQWIKGLMSNPKTSYTVGQLLASFQQSSSKIAAGTQSLTNASKKMSDALSQIQSGTQTINDGIKGIKWGSTILYSGSGKIMNGNDQLAKGLNTLHQQQNKLSSGANRLSVGSDRMNGKLVSLTSGVDQFSNRLNNGLNRPISPGNVDQQAELFSNPERSQIKDLHQVNNYGEGLSPYILSLGLFVGALAFATFFPLRRPAIKPTSGGSWFLSKYSVTAAVSVFQAILICILLLKGVGLQVTNEGQFYFFSILASLSFFTLIQFLVTAFGNIGRAIAGLLLLVQFGGSSGIFPVSLTPAFFQWIHAFLPMTYSVNGLRQIISIGDDSTYLIRQVFILIGITVISMLLTWLTFNTLLKKGDSKVINDQRTLNV